MFICNCLSVPREQSVVVFFHCFHVMIKAYRSWTLAGLRCGYYIEPIFEFLSETSFWECCELSSFLKSVSSNLILTNNVFKECRITQLTLTYNSEGGGGKLYIWGCMHLLLNNKIINNYRSLTRSTLQMFSIPYSLIKKH